VIQTVLGPIDPADLGTTLAHEHALIDLRCLLEPPHDPEMQWLVDRPVDAGSRIALQERPYASKDNLMLQSEEHAALELQAFRDAGGQGLIDLTVDGIGPDASALRRLATRTGLHIVAGVGIYRAIAHPAWVRTAGVADIADYFIKRLQVGFESSDVRGGVLGEIGTSSPLHPDEIKVLRAAARAYRETGVAINVHPAIWHREGPRILDILAAEGVDLRRVALSHMDELLDYDYHCALAVRGAFLSFDTFGSEFHFADEDAREPTDRERLAALLRLLAAGWAGQILLSQDVCTKLQLTRYGGKGYAHVLRSVVPALEASGVSAETIHELLVVNPRRFLAGS
jgi:phosphotriesterase-related protein